MLTLLRITGDDELANPVFVDYVPRQRRARRATAACEAWNMAWKRTFRKFHTKQRDACVSLPSPFLRPSHNTAPCS